MKPAFNLLYKDIFLAGSAYLCANLIFDNEGQPKFIGLSSILLSASICAFKFISENFKLTPKIMAYTAVGGIAGTLILNKLAVKIANDLDEDFLRSASKGEHLSIMLSINAFTLSAAISALVICSASKYLER